MSATEVLEKLTTRGVEIVVQGDRLRYRPKEAVPPDLHAAVIEHKADLIRLVSQDTGQGALPPDNPLASVLNMRLSDFERSGRPLAVQTPWWPDPLWFVPTDADAATLMSEGVSRGRIWTARELLDLLSVPGITKDQARMVALAKLEFGGDVVGVRPGGAATA